MGQSPARRQTLRYVEYQKTHATGKFALFANLNDAKCKRLENYQIWYGPTMFFSQIHDCYSLCCHQCGCSVAIDTVAGCCFSSLLIIPAFYYSTSVKKHLHWHVLSFWVWLMAVVNCDNWKPIGKPDSPKVRIFVTKNPLGPDCVVLGSKTQMLVFKFNTVLDFFIWGYRGDNDPER